MKISFEKNSDKSLEITVIKAQENDFILNKSTPFSIREAYNALRTNIIFSIPKDGCKIIGVTSAERAEGKSLNTLNLALSFAEASSHILLIDCDLRKPKIGRLLNIKSSPGIANVLVNMQTINRSIKKTRYENLDVLLSGGVQPNPTELLVSDKFSNLLQELSKLYDYIFIDTPPVNAVTDASIISKHLSGYVFVVRQGESERDSVLNALEQLKFVNAKVLGFLFNDVMHSKNYKKRNYKYKYEYRSNSNNKERVEAPVI